MKIGIRKVVGAERKQLIFQFIGEAVIVTVIALGYWGSSFHSWDYLVFNNFSGKQIAV
ncbi:MAG: FtsX-like permease family protein [Cytophagales bacterium]|nr:FtsX-like permease family protein [Cytophagales bacterium]